MTPVDVHRATFALLDACADFDRAIREALTPTAAVSIQVQLGQVIDVLRTSALNARHRAEQLSGIKE